MILKQNPAQAEKGKEAIPISAKGNGRRSFSELPTLKDERGKSAEELCEEAVKLLRRGKRQSRFNQAVEKAKEAKRREPENAHPFNISGICLHQRGEKNEENGWRVSAKEDYEKAIADYSMAIKLNPANPGFYSNRAKVSRSLANISGANEKGRLLAQAAQDEKVSSEILREIGKRMSKPS